MRYRVDATLTICLKDDIGSKDDFEGELSDGVIQVAEKRLTLLDVRGGSSGDNGFIEHMQCDGVDNWERL